MADVTEGSGSFIALYRRQESLEHTLEELQVRLTLQIESLQNQVHKQARTATPAKKFTAIATSNVQSTETDASRLKGVEEGLAYLEKVHEHLLAASSTASSNQVGTASAMKALESRLEQLERAGAGDSSAEQRRQMTNTGQSTVNVHGLDDLLAEVAEIQKWRAQVDRHLALGAGQGKVSTWSTADMEALNSGPGIETGAYELEKKHHSEDHIPFEGITPVAGGDSNVLDAAFARKRKYEFAESVYDSLFFLGMDFMGLAGTLLMVLGFYINLTMQLGVVLIIWANFIDQPFPPASVERFNYWRASASHSFYNADDLTGNSLAARVCGLDESLPVATIQMESWKLVAKYIKGDGQFLCNIAVILWYFCCAYELRKTINFALGICSVPRGRRTKIRAGVEGFAFSELSHLRLMLGMVVGLCRFVIAMLLMIIGSLWLAWEESIMDLLLNASALGFVLDIDETIFGVVAPLLVQGAISSMAPLKLPSAKSLLAIPVTIFTVAVGLGILLNFTLVQDLTRQMDHIYEALCSSKKELNFITGSNALGWVTFAKSVPYHNTNEAMSGIIEAKRWVTQLIIDKDERASIYADNMSTVAVSRNLQTIRSASALELSQLANEHTCIDMPLESHPSKITKLGARLWLATGNRAFETVQDCSEVIDYCLGGNSSLISQNVRFMCPDTCGCSDPMSGLWTLMWAQAGCPEDDCRDKITRKLSSNSSYQCRDTNVTDLQSSKWPGMLKLMLDDKDIVPDEFDNLTDMGCDALQYLPSSLKDKVCQNNAPIEFLGAGTFCPESCGCYPLWGDEDNEDVGLCPSQACRERMMQEHEGYEEHEGHKEHDPKSPRPLGGVEWSEDGGDGGGDGDGDDDGSDDGSGGGVVLSGLKGAGNISGDGGGGGGGVIVSSPQGASQIGGDGGAGGGDGVVGGHGGGSPRPLGGVEWIADGGDGGGDGDGDDDGSGDGSGGGVVLSGLKGAGNISGDGGGGGGVIVIGPQGASQIGGDGGAGGGDGVVGGHGGGANAGGVDGAGNIGGDGAGDGGSDGSGDGGGAAVNASGANASGVHVSGADAGGAKTSGR